MKRLLTMLLSLICVPGFAQDPQENIAVLQSVLTHYYKSEKIIVKDRNQHLFLFCEKPNNNEEIFETVNKLSLPKAEAANIKKQVLSDVEPGNWQGELEAVYAKDASKLKSKINSCLSLEQYQEKQKKFNLNNQRLMIISKPVYFLDHKTALVKVVFYRSIEHNSGSVLMLEKTPEGWKIIDFLNPWST